MKKSILKILGYAGVVILLLLATKCDNGVKITTPQKDAKHIAELAEIIESEADLRAVEKLATKYELAYRHSTDGATAMKFKNLVEPILIAAGERRDSFRAAEDYLAEQKKAFNDKLDVLDAAWQLTLTTATEDRAKVVANNSAIEDAENTIAELTVHKEALGFEVVDKGYPEDLLAEIGKVEDAITEQKRTIEELEYQNTIIHTAYQLQRGCCLEIVDVQVVEDSADETAVEVATVEE